MFSLTEPAFFTRLRDARRVLVAGAGGGFDVYAGLPLALALASAGKEVHLANLSFADLHGLDLDVWPAPDVAAVRPETAARGDYFPDAHSPGGSSGRVCRPRCTRCRAPESGRCARPVAR